MKSLEITTNKRLLIVEYATVAERAVEWVFMTAFKNPNIINHGHKVKPICFGSNFTEEIAHDIVIRIPGCIMTYHLANGHDGNITSSAMESFISAIEAQGWYWAENPEGMETACSEAGDYSRWSKAEARTLHPERVIIFEIAS